MTRIWAAILLAAVVGSGAGCGSGSSNSSLRTPSAPGTLRVNEVGTSEFIPVTSGINLFIPAGAVNQSTTFTVSPFDHPVSGFPFTGNERFISGLQFQGFVSLGRPAELQIPVFTTIPLTPTATIAVFQQTTTGEFVQIPVTSITNGVVTFQTTTPGTFLVVLQTV